MSVFPAFSLSQNIFVHPKRINKLSKWKAKPSLPTSAYGVPPFHSTTPFLQPWENNNGVEFFVSPAQENKISCLSIGLMSAAQIWTRMHYPCSILKGVQPKFRCLQPPNSFHFPSSFLSVKGQNDASLHIRLVNEPMISFTTSAKCVVGHSSPGFHHAPCK